ncbi:methyl-accepting chemotaxis protein [Novosphingobium sp. 2580]|uniref:Methyl-accepting chemotaxis protein n=2 Tax=Novosphingobium album (ex Hu et al. 2023) TaxID=2930093 RepID=A0ABT0AYN3_9SPHN|nr:methyl-accepting chemotaxis protein [Novosphingobium album (ex Hu et al. 2023)]
MAPLFLSFSLLCLLTGVTLHLERSVANANDAALDAESLAFELGELRSVSRSLQRDALNLISEPAGEGRSVIMGKFDKRKGKMEEDLRSLQESASAAGLSPDFFTTQASVIAELSGVVEMAGAGNAVAATDHFRNRVRPAERAASEIADARIDALKEEIVTLRESATSTATDFRIVLLAATAILSALGLWAGFLITRRSVVLPLNDLRESMGVLASGRTDAAIPHGGRADEIGQMSQSMSVFRDQLAAAERSKEAQTALIVDSIGSALSRLADGDLVYRVETKLEGPFAKLRTDFNEAATSLQTAFSQVAQVAGGINGGASEIRAASDDLAQRTEQQAASLEETAAAMNQITSTVGTTADRAASANAVVRSVRQEAEQSGTIVRNAVEAMSGIERTSSEISEIISVIDGIAFQTNLLALNAGVEAARAGDAGKGFAVVASEVRALAQRSAEAATNVKSRISASSVQVQSGVQFVGETGDALKRIIERIGEIDSIVAEIAESALDQSSGLQQVNRAVADMDVVTQQNAAMVEEATAAARSLSAEATGLAEQIARFRTDGAGTPVTKPAQRPAARRPAPATPARNAVPLSIGNAALAINHDDWSEF